MFVCLVFSIGVRFFFVEKVFFGVGFELLLLILLWRILLCSFFKLFKCWFDDVFMGDGVRCWGWELFCGVRGWNFWFCSVCCVKGGIDWLCWYEGGGIWFEEFVVWLYIVLSFGE